ncbi:hypothetical protein [Commensalibacter melissae]|uniref:hypothetical protein n=1 Tax=Commensalibacter melissae TaxID=2070537 RepID=UPI0012D9D585|nr:hypothetical protein [Commensalibacter melissae]MUG09402.1 hypothetical protein [Commensalibacter melissae]
MVKTAENSQSSNLSFGGKPPFSENVVKGGNVELINELGDARIIASDRFVDSVLIKNELRILDIDLAQRFGFERPRDIRKLTNRYL